jgi:hypothetical protein
MAYPEDLLVYARQMAEQYPTEAHQPSLRRSLSSAYYALFHLLISDAVANCSDPRFRATLARMFDHGPMKNVCENTIEKIKNLFHPTPPSEPVRTIQYHLHNVAETFSQAYSAAPYTPDRVIVRLEETASCRAKAWSRISRVSSGKGERRQVVAVSGSKKAAYAVASAGSGVWAV